MPLAHWHTNRCTCISSACVVLMQRSTAIRRPRAPTRFQFSYICRMKCDPPRHICQKVSPVGIRHCQTAGQCHTSALAALRSLCVGHAGMLCVVGYSGRAADWRVAFAFAVMYAVRACVLALCLFVLLLVVSLSLYCVCFCFRCRLAVLLPRRAGVVLRVLVGMSLSPYVLRAVRVCALHLCLCLCVLCRLGFPC